MMIINLPHSRLSRSAEMNGSEYRLKQLDSVNTERKDASAFIGESLKPGATIEVPVGTWIMSYHKDMSSSGKTCRGQEVRLYQVGDDGYLTERKTFDLGPRPGWPLRCRDDIAAFIGMPPSGDALRAERSKLAARIAEIDKLLGALPAAAPPSAGS